MDPCVVVASAQFQTFRPSRHQLTGHLTKATALDLQGSMDVDMSHHVDLWLFLLSLTLPTPVAPTITTLDFLAASKASAWYGRGSIPPPLLRKQKKVRGGGDGLQAGLRCSPLCAGIPASRQER